MNVFQQSQPLKGASEFSKTAQTNFFEPLLGDVNSDGTLDILDLVTLANLILGGQFNSIGDMNQDGQLDILDIVTLVNVILG